MNYYTKSTIIGDITLVEERGFITNLYFSTATFHAEYRESEVIELTYRQIFAYLEGALRNFSIPLNPKGTNFQQRVWGEVLKVPYGKSISYKELAMSVGNEHASRAVGNAVNKNPIPIIIPCHRVIGSDKSLVGYAYGIELKKKLLRKEGVIL